jgi:hypothetical protein
LDGSRWKARFVSVELDTPVEESMICERLRCKCYNDVESLKVGRTACSPGNFPIVEARPVGCERLMVGCESVMIERRACPMEGHRLNRCEESSTDSVPSRIRPIVDLVTHRSTMDPVKRQKSTVDLVTTAQTGS